MWNRRCEGGEYKFLLGETRRTRCSNKVTRAASNKLTTSLTLSSAERRRFPNTGRRNQLRCARAGTLNAVKYAVKFFPAQGYDQPCTRRKATPPGRPKNDGGDVPVAALWRRIAWKHSGCGFALPPAAKFHKQFPALLPVLAARFHGRKAGPPRGWHRRR